MKSRWVRQSIIIVILMCAIIILVVVIGNWNSIKRKLGQNPTAAVEAETDPESSGGQVGSNLSGFMEDEGFFDEDKYDSGILVESGTKVSVMMDAVGGNLRIMVVDSMGNLVSGSEFTASIEGKGLYPDSDMDGIITIEHLDEGQYFVSLEPMENYIVPATKTMINISTTLEYKALSDISFLIAKENEVDTELEDTEVNLARKEADGSENIELDAYSEKGKTGIMVSGRDGEIDWETVVNSKTVDYAIIRCGYRGSDSGTLIRDSLFKENMMGAIKANMPVGVYFFSQAVNEAEAIEEASMVISECKLYMLDFPIFVSCESAGGDGRADGLSVSQRTAVVKAFCETIVNSGYEAGVYAPKSWWMDELDAEQLSLYHNGLAQYAAKPDYEGYFDYWQYTDKGLVEGIEAKVGLLVHY